jgi:hypothetical protein
MKLIYTDKISLVSTSFGNLNSSYSISKVLNNQPKQPYISNNLSPQIKVNLEGAEAFFMSYLAETVSILFKDGLDGTGSTTGSYSPSGNNYNLSEAFLLNGRTHWNESIFVLVPSTTKSAIINLSNSVDVKGSIDYWSAAGSSMGKFMVGGGSGSTADHDKFPQVKLGTSVIGTDGQANQIERITGTGSGNADIKLASGGSSSQTITSMKLPVIINTIKAGNLLTTFNPTVGLSNAKETFGVQQEKSSGLSFRVGETRRVFSGSFQVKESDRANTMRILEGLRVQPIAAEILNYQTNTSVFGSFLSSPSLTYTQQGSQLYDVNFEFKEII